MITSQTLVDATKNNQVDNTGVALWGYLTDIIRYKNFEGCNELLKHLNIEETDNSLLITLLVGTQRMDRDILIDRPKFFEQFKQKLIREKGVEETEAIFWNLSI